MGDWADDCIRREEDEKLLLRLSGAPSGPGLVNPNVVDQDKYWWDVKAERHEIDAMDLDYVLKVLCFCYENPYLRDDFPESLLQDKLFTILNEACEAAWKYENLA